MKRRTNGGRTDTGTSGRRTPAAIDRVTDRLEARWGSLPEVEVSLGLRVRFDRDRFGNLRVADFDATDVPWAVGGEVLA